MGIILKGLGDYAVEETNLVKNYIEKGLNQEEAVDKALDESYLNIFQKGALYQNNIHFEGINLEDAFDIVESLFSKIGTTIVHVDKENLIQQYLMVLFQEPDDYTNRLGIEAKIIKNDPSYAKLRFASTLQDEENNQKIVNNLTDRVISAFAPYIVKPGARRVDSELHAGVQELLRRTSDNVLEPRAVFSGGTENKDGVYIVPRKGTFEVEYSIDTFSEIEISEIDVLGFKVVDAELEEGTLKGIEFKDDVTNITLEDLIIGPGKDLKLMEAELEPPEDYSTMIMQYVGMINDTQFTKAFESDCFLEGGRVKTTKALKIAKKVARFVPYVNKVVKALDK